MATGQTSVPETVEVKGFSGRTLQWLKSYLLNRCQRIRPDDLLKVKHAVTGNPITPPFPDHMKMATFGMGCFWGAERKFWGQPGVFSTQVGFCGGHKENPTNDEVNSGSTGHAEVVRVIYDPQLVSYRRLLDTFWSNHDPTQSMRQGPHVGPQYRSALYYHDDEQRILADETRGAYQEDLRKGGLSDITTEIKEAGVFYYADELHQQYLHKHPSESCSSDAK